MLTLRILGRRVLPRYRTVTKPGTIMASASSATATQSGARPLNAFMIATSSAMIANKTLIDILNLLDTR
jgi:hypothetical protein